jgi:hypothetical protein
MDADQLLQSLGLALGLPNLRFDGNGCARIAIDGAPALNFERDESGAIHLYSVLAPLPPEGREALYGQLLQGNLFGTATAGASLAIDTLLGEILLCRTVFSELVTAQAFSAQVEAFVAAAEDWQRRVAGMPVAGGAEAGAPAAPRMMEHFLRG